MPSEAKPKVSRKEKRRQEVARQKRKRLLTLGLPASLIILVFAGLLLYRIFEPDLPGMVAFGTQPRTHDPEAEFVQTGLPPTGGSHNPNWQNCGIYDTPIDDGLAVHSLEHGAVWLTYHPDLEPEKIADLRDLVAGQSYTLMSPYPDLAAEVVMSAWSRQLVIESFPDERVADFIARYREQGPEPGAPCTDGIGVPIQ